MDEQEAVGTHRGECLDDALGKGIVDGFQIAVGQKIRNAFPYVKDRHQRPRSSDGEPPNAETKQHGEAGQDAVGEEHRHHAEERTPRQGTQHEE